MNKIIIIITALILFTQNIRSQNDTIYLKSDSLIYQNVTYNKIIELNNEGPWIEYETINNDFLIVHWCGEDSLGNSTSGQYKVKTRYISDKELKTLDSNLNSKDWKYQNEDKIPKENYFISGKGEYLNNQKNGKWEYYYPNGNIKEEILYKSGKPNSDFTFFYENGAKKMTLIKLEDKFWRVSKYNAEGKLISNEILKFEDLKSLY